MSRRAAITLIVGIVGVFSMSVVVWSLLQQRYQPQANVELQARRFPSYQLLSFIGAAYKNDDCQDGGFLDDLGGFIACDANDNGKTMTGYFEWLATHRDATWGGGRDNAAQGTLRKLSEYSTAHNLPAPLFFNYERPLDDHDYTEYRAGGRAELMDRAAAAAYNYEDFYLHYGANSHLTGFRSYPKYYETRPSVEDRLYYLYEYRDGRQPLTDRLINRSSEWYDANNGEGANVQLDSSATDLYLGHFDRFYEIFFTVPQGKSGITGEWQYCNAAGSDGLCTAWASFPNQGQITNQFKDLTNGLQNGGRLYFIPPSDWQRNALANRAQWGYQSETNDRYWYIRYHMNAGQSGTMPTIKKVRASDFIKFVGKDNTYNFSSQSQGNSDQKCSDLAGWPEWDQPNNANNFKNNPRAACYLLPGWNPINDENSDGFVDDDEHSRIPNHDPYATARQLSEARAPFTFVDYPSYIRYPTGDGFVATITDLYKYWLGFEQGQGSGVTFNGIISDNAVSFGDWNGVVVTEGGAYDPNNAYGPGYFAEYNRNRYATCEPISDSRYSQFCARASTNPNRQAFTVTGNTRDGDYSSHKSGLWDVEYGRLMSNIKTAALRDVGQRYFGYNPASGTSPEIEQSLDIVLKEFILRSRHSYAKFEQELTVAAGLQSAGKTVAFDNLLEMIPLTGATENAQEQADPYSPLKTRDKLFGIAQYLLARSDTDYFTLFSTANNPAYHATENPANRRFKRDGTPYTAFDSDKDVWSELLTLDLGNPTNALPAIPNTTELDDSQNMPILPGKGVFVFTCNSNPTCDNTQDPAGNNGAIASEYRLYGRLYSNGITLAKWGSYGLGSYDYLNRGNLTFDDLSAEHALGKVYRAAAANAEPGRYFDTARLMPNHSALVGFNTQYHATTDDRLQNDAQTLKFERAEIDVPAATLSGAQQLLLQKRATELTPPTGKQIVPGIQYALTLSEGNSFQPGKNILVKFNYAGADLGGNAPTTLAVGKCDRGVCIALPSQVDIANNRVEANVDGLSDFVILAPGNGEPTPPPSPTASPTPFATPSPTATSGAGGEANENPAPPSPDNNGQFRSATGGGVKNGSAGTPTSVAETLSNLNPTGPQFLPAALIGAVLTFLLLML